MKFKLTIVLFLVCFACFSQTDFKIATTYKRSNGNDFKAENFTFTYNKQNGIFSKLDNDLNIETKYHVEYYNSAYTSDGETFVLAFMTNLSKVKQNSYKDNFIGLFSIFYDHKNGNVIGVKINPVNTEQNGHSSKEEFYINELGKKYL